MKILVTGASGFIGSAVAARLARRGDRVRALVRAASDRSNLSGLDIELVDGDLTRPETLAPALAGCTVLFHVAADYRLWVPQPEVMYRANVDGTRALMEAALAAGVERVVYTSSVATLLPDAAARPVDETAEAPLTAMTGHYKGSKWLAERLVLDMVRERGLPAVVVNPSAPVGPGDRKPTPTGRMVLDAASGKIPVYVSTGLNIVHVGDVAEGHVQALERGRAGERYILGSENLSLKTIVDTVAEIAGRKGPRLRVPHNAILPVAYAAEAWARITGQEPAVTVDGIRLAKKHMYFSSDKARRELGYAPRPAVEALRHAVEWYREHGYL